MDQKDLKQIKDTLQDGFEEQGRFIDSAFQDQKEHFDELINDLRDDLKGDIERVETKLDRALYTELTHLEARVKRLEQKVDTK
ncbi:MAG: hypothetical protein Q8P83_03535 [bacterium]|nr:hypothetical protein [bacterium]